MKTTKALALLAATVTVGATALAAEAIDNRDAAGAALTRAGYGDFRDLEKDDGLWEVEVRGEDGKYRDIHIVAASGEILDPASGKAILTADDLVTKLRGEGYSNFTDLDLDDAVWEVEATAADGEKVELVINGFDGTVLHSSPDR